MVLVLQLPHPLHPFQHTNKKIQGTSDTPGQRFWRDSSCVYSLEVGDDIASITSARSECRA